jgi:hypothetical protein
VGKSSGNFFNEFAFQGATDVGDAESHGSTADSQERDFPLSDPVFDRSRADAEGMGDHKFIDQIRVRDWRGGSGWRLFDGHWAKSKCDFASCRIAQRLDGLGFPKIKSQASYPALGAKHYRPLGTQIFDAAPLSRDSAHMVRASYSTCKEFPAYLSYSCSNFRRWSSEAVE